MCACVYACVFVCMRVCLCGCVCLFLSHLSSTASLYNYLPTWPIHLPSTPFLSFPSLPFPFISPFHSFYFSLLFSCLSSLPCHSFPSFSFFHSLLFIPFYTSFHLFPFIPSSTTSYAFFSDCLLSLVWACMCVGERVRARG